MPRKFEAEILAMAPTMSAPAIASALDMDERAVRRTLHACGGRPVLAKRFLRPLSVAQRERILDLWAGAEATAREIIAASGAANYAQVRKVVERARIDGDPRGIFSKERDALSRCKAAQAHERGAALAPREAPLAERFGIRVGATLERINTDHRGMAKVNRITLSAGVCAEA